MDSEYDVNHAPGRSDNFDHGEMDLLELFFADLAQVEAIMGKRHYLPLTREIERGRVFERLRGDNDSITLRNTINALNKTSQRLVRYFESEKNLIQDSLIVSGMVDKFFEDPRVQFSDLLTSAAKARMMNFTAEDEYTELLWRYFYLLSLLPYSVRNNYDDVESTPEINSHFLEVDRAHQDSRQKLTEGALRYVVNIAYHFVDSGIPYLDLVQEGSLGLLAAIDRFRERKGAHFQSYAAEWIMQRLQRFIADFSRPIRLPVHVHEKRKGFDQIIDGYRLTAYTCLPTDLDLLVCLGGVTQHDIAAETKFKRDRQKFERLQLRLLTFEKLFGQISKENKDIHEDHIERVTALRLRFEQILQKTGKPPRSIQIFQDLGWLTAEEIEFMDAFPSSASQNSEVQKKLKNAHRIVNQYKMLYARHYSSETLMLDFLMPDSQVSFEEILVDDSDSAKEALDKILAEEVEAVFSGLKARERDVLNARFGISGGAEATLEEIGADIGVTRERIRQIEAKALLKLRHPTRSNKLKTFFEESDRTRTSKYIGYSYCQLVRVLVDIDLLEDVAQEIYVQEQKEQIKGIIEKYDQQGRRRISPPQSKSGRVYIFKKILEDAGEPLHYTVIHERAIAQLPQSHQFSVKTTYATLFYKEQFRLLGGAIFGLTEWDSFQHSTNGDSVLLYCPQPLLSTTSEPRSFFESIMVGREVLKRNPNLSAQEFWNDMCAWAQQSSNNIHNAQAAFDVWYAAGLLGRINFIENPFAIPKLAVSPDAKLNDVRVHCLSTLCKRLAKMPELLLTVDRIAHSSLSNIQKVLFGSEQAGADVATRLTLFEAFEAVQREGSEWRLTSVGRSILDTNPPQELPDFGELASLDELESNQAETELEWEEDLDLLDI